MSELEKMKDVQKESQAIGEFLEWLNTKGWFICQWFEDEDSGEEEQLLPIHKGIEQLLAEYYHIDLVKVEQEKKEILDDFNERTKVKKDGGK